MCLRQPAIVLMVSSLLLHHGLEGHLLPMADPKGNASETYQSTVNSSQDPLYTLLSSVSSKSLQSQLPPKGVSCEDLMPDALGDYSNVPQASQILIRAALTLALQGAGCSQHAGTLVLELYKELGQEDADAFLFMLVGALGTARSPSESKKSAALHFNLDQLAPPQTWHCQGVMQVNGSLLHGRVRSVYRGFRAAAAACHHLGDSCAGVASNGTGSFQAVDRAGSYFLPQDGARSWLHRCHRLARVRRSPDCFNEKEQNAHSVVEWIPAASTFYNFGTSIYYATQGCTDLAKERAIEGAMDLGYDMLTAMTGGAGGVARMGIMAALKPGYKVGMHHLVSYFTQGEDPYPVPTNYSGPVTII